VHKTRDASNGCSPVRFWARSTRGWLLRSLGSAGLRFERQCFNAQALATMLRGHPAVRAVRYPGLSDDPAYPVAAAQMRRFGGLVSIELADAAAVHALVQRSELLIAATSLGGIHTSVDRRARWGDPFSDGFARIALGIEDTDDPAGRRRTRPRGNPMTHEPQVGPLPYTATWR
jgi:cystathionine beta-lyase/cystathionine gamma-synthase